MRGYFVLVAAAASVNGAVVVAAPEPVSRVEAHLVPMDELTVPIVDGARSDGTLRVKLVLEMADAAAAEKAGEALPALRSAALATTMEFARLYASPMTPVNVAQLATDMTAALRAQDGQVKRALIVEVAANRA